MEGRCDKHPFERMERHCRTCGGEFCNECLVYSYGHKKPPYCVSCALSAAGVRSTAARPQVLSKRELKREIKARKRAEKVAAKDGANAEAAGLLDAQPVSTAPLVEFELTINDDGSVERDVRSGSVLHETAGGQDAPTRSIFDREVEEQVS
jgi:hypothetical protein